MLPRLSSTTEWPSPHVVAQCAILPFSTTTVAGLGFLWRPGHLAQPQGLEPRCSPLYRYAVADTPIPVAPLGFSDTGSPMPWHYAFTSDVNIGPKPGRTLLQNPLHCCPKATLELPSFPRPPSISTPLTTEAAQTVQIPGFRSAFSHELPPAPRLVSPHSFKMDPLSRIHSTHHPAIWSAASRLPPGPKVPSSLGPCFCRPCAPPFSPWLPEGLPSSTEFANNNRSTRRSVSRKPKPPRSLWPKPEALQTPNHRSCC